MADNELINMSEFARLDVRIGNIVSAERIEGSKKLIKLDVDVGDETRQLVAGIAEEYTPEELKPAKLMGVESQGMILAVDVAGKPILLHPDKEVPAGSRVR
jgi:methionine--tRNA ligase beta chain